MLRLSMLRRLGGLVGLVVAYAWAIVPMLADWCGSLGSAKPNSETGQIDFIKGIHAGGYVTGGQARWFEILYGVNFVVLALLIIITRRVRQPEEAEPTNTNSALELLSAAVWIALLLGGGHWISLVVTGSWALPDHRPV